MDLLALIKRSFINTVANKHTYCPYMWQSVYVFYNGDVYVCCHNKPAKIGSIYSESLGSIWSKSKTLKQFRLMSKLNCLGCFEDCNLISKSDKDSYPSNYELRKYPKTVWLNCGEFCNIRCTMCPQNHRSNQFLNPEALKANIDWEHVQDVVLQGGEILAMKTGRELFLYLTQKLNKKLQLVTNGLLIDDLWAENLIYGCSSIIISVNAASKEVHERVNVGSDFNKVMANVHKLITLKKTRATNTNIIFKYTIALENIMDIYDAILLAKSVGCDGIEFGYDHLVIEFFEQNDNCKTLLKTKIEHLVNDSAFHGFINVSRLQHLGLVH